MSENFATAFALEEMLVRARESHSQVYQRWCDLGARLAANRGDPVGHAKEQLDGDVDLLLRDLEREQLDAIEHHGVLIDGGALFLQISLSKMWLLSTYETVRLNCAFKPCAPQLGYEVYCAGTECLRCRLKAVLGRLSTFRMPLAKLEPEKSRGKSASVVNHQPELVIDEHNGSVGWRVLSDRTPGPYVDSRLALSDFVLGQLS
jgi:hypothetical protein